LALDLQVKLLRVIETGEFMRVGESKPTRIDVRIIAASNRDLHKEIESGNFREDLYYRISVFLIRLPSLRERIDDIEPLAYHFLQFFSLKTGKRIDKISADCLNTLKLHTWKGNIRELRNVIERCVILATGKEITTDLLPIEIQNNIESNTNDKPLSTFDLASLEKQHIQRILNYTKGNKTKAAELLGIALTTLYRKLSENNLK